MKNIPIEISARHVHLAKNDWRRLFGNMKIVIDHQISQPGQFVAKQRVLLREPKGTLNHVAIVDPFRSYTQCELSQTDARLLGLIPPLSHSGNLENASLVKIEGLVGGIERAAAIIAQRHFHITPTEAKALGLNDQQRVTINIPGERGTYFTNVVVRVHKNSRLSLHIDTDEGNACGYKKGMTSSIIS